MGDSLQTIAGSCWSKKQRLRTTALEFLYFVKYGNGYLHFISLGLKNDKKQFK